MNEKYQREFDLFDMILSLFGHWRSLLLAVIVGILLGSGLYILQQLLVEAEPEIIEAHEYEPSEGEVGTMEMAAEYRKLYESQLAYKRNSVLMHLDTDQIYEGKITYYLYSGSDTAYFSFLYQNLINKSDVLEQMRKAGGLDCDERYLKELLSSVSVRVDDYYVKENPNLFLEDEKYIAKNVVLEFKVIYDDQKVCEDMLKVLSDAVEELDEECSELYSDYVLKTVSNDVTQSVRSDVLDLQRSCADVLNMYKDGIAKYENLFSEDAKKYYETEYLGKNTGETEKVEEVVAQSGVSTAGFAKRGLAGAVLLCICWAGIWVLQYIFDGRIKNPDYVKEICKIPIISRLDILDNTKCCLDRWIVRLKKRNAHISDDIVYTAYSVSALGKDRIVFSGNNNAIAEQIVTTLKQDCVDVLDTGYIHRDRQVLENAKKAEGLVLVVILNETTYDEVQKELTICRMQNISVLGAVVLG